MATLLLIIIIQLFLQGYTADVDPCATAVDLHRAGDRGTNCSGIQDQICDRYAIDPTVWYKVPSPSNVDNLYKDMATNAPELNHCGTSFPIWLNGTMPHDNHSIKNVTACIRGLHHICQTSYNITVMKCDLNHVYKLKPTNTCDVAYCFGHERCHSPTDTHPVSSTVDPALLEPCNTTHHLHRAGDRGTECSIDDSAALCDRYDIEDTWYRVINGDNQDLELVTTPPKLNTCGTSFPIWLNGTHPTNGFTVNRTACQHGILGSCIHHYDVSIKHCDSYYVYRLQKALVCDAAYCFGQDRHCESPNYNNKAVPGSPFAVLLAVSAAVVWVIGRQSFCL